MQRPAQEELELASARVLRHESEEVTSGRTEDLFGTEATEQSFAFGIEAVHLKMATTRRLRENLADGARSRQVRVGEAIGDGVRRVRQEVDPRGRAELEV